MGTTSINESFIQKMELKTHQYIAFLHRNTKHKHIHLYVNRIDYQGKAYNDQFVSNRASRAAENIALEKGLTAAKEVQAINHAKSQKKTPAIEAIRHLAHETLKEAKSHDVGQFVSDFNQRGHHAQLRAAAYSNKKGEFVGLRFYAQGQKYKASEVDKGLAKQSLEQKLARNKVLEKQRERAMTFWVAGKHW